MDNHPSPWVLSTIFGLGRIFLLAAIFLMPTEAAPNPTPLPPPLMGDLSGDRVVDLADVIIGLQVVSRAGSDFLRPDYSFAAVDVDGDNRAGLAEVIYAARVSPLTGGFGIPVFTGLSPSGGEVGDSITLTGSGFDPAKTYTVTVGGVAAAVENVTTTAISFTIAPGTVTGELVVDDGDFSYTTVWPFTLENQVTGTLALPPGVSPQGYSVGTGTTIVDPDPVSGTFSVPLADGAIRVVWAFRNPADPVFMAVLTGDETAATIDAVSTAQALAYLSPFFSGRNPDRATVILQTLNGMAELATLAGLITTLSGDARDYINDTRIDAALNDLITQALAQVPPPTAAAADGDRSPLAFAGGTPTGTRLKEINPDYSGTLPATNITLETKLQGDPPDQARDFFLLDVSKRAAASNPVDWWVEVFDVDPDQFSAGLTSIDQLTHRDTLELLVHRPKFGFVTAELFTANFDLVEQISNLVMNINLPLILTEAAVNPLAPNQFRLLKALPGVYLVQAYSGNLWYGTGLLPSLPEPPAEPNPNFSRNQVYLLDANDPNDAWVGVLATNVTIAAIDIASTLVDLKNFMGDRAIVGFVQSVITDVGKVIRNLKVTDDGLTVDEVMVLLKTVVGAIQKAAISEATSLLSDAEGFSRLASGTLKTLAKIFDISGKISGVGQSIERTIGFTTPYTLALERSVVVVGDPFNPAIERVFPNSGLEGDTVALSGRNFGFPLDEGSYTNDPNEDLTVSFCQFTQSSTDPENQPSDVSLALEILSRSETQAVVTVPDNFDDVFTDGFPVYVCMTRNDKETNSRTLADAGQFALLDPPAILEVAPPVVRPGGFLTISGERFGDDPLVVFDETDITFKPARVTDDFLVVALPRPSQTPFLNNGAHTVSVRRNQKQTSPAGFTVGYPDPGPAPAQPPPGYLILVSKADMSNTPDGHISLYEAMLLANGDLGRTIEVHMEGEDPGTPREEDLIWGYFDDEGNVRQVAPDHRDVIATSAARLSIICRDAGMCIVLYTPDIPAAAGVVAVDRTLPPIGSGDWWDLDGITLEGSGAPAGAGLLFDGTTEARIDDLVLTGFSGDGIRLANQSSHNRLNNVSVNQTGGHGLSFFNASSANTIMGLTIQNVQGHGIFLEGNSDHNSFEGLSIADVGQAGIHLEQNAVQNRFTELQQPLDSYSATIDTTGGHGIHLAAGANRNEFTNLHIDNAGGSGIYLQDHALENTFVRMVVSAPLSHGLHLSGDLVRYNRFYSTHTPGLDDAESRAAWQLADVYRQAGGYGIRLDEGADRNLVAPWQVYGNQAGGILVSGYGSDQNVIGKKYRFVPSLPYDIDAIQVYDNNGHGIEINDDASENTLQLINVAGNNGDGVLITGPGTRDNHLSGIWTGYLYGPTSGEQDSVLKPNAGSGLHLADGASDTLVGSPSISRNSFVNDAKDGILLEGPDTRNNRIVYTDVGARYARTQIGITNLASGGPGRNGIALVNQANENEIGALRVEDRLHVDAAANAGLLIDDSHTNRVRGVFINSSMIEYNDGTHKSRVGIHLTNDAGGNLLGLRGPMVGDHPSPFAFDNRVLRTLTVEHTSEAGVWIEDAGGFLSASGQRSAANIIQNSSLQSLGAGIRLTGRAQVNDIGGPVGGPTGFIQFNRFYTMDDNTIQGKRAGVWFDNVENGAADTRNRFMNNFVSSSADDLDPAPAIDPRTGPPEGVGVLITGGSDGTIFGEGIATPNYIETNRVGIFMDGTEDTIVRGNLIGSAFAPNTLAGIVLRNSNYNLIGDYGADGYNIISSNGILNGEFGFGSGGPTANPDAAGILLINSHDNQIQGNEISDNQAFGVLVSESGRNRIGATQRTMGNIIAANGRDGLRLAGFHSRLNEVRFNRIGTDPQGRVRGNSGSGITLMDGAAENLVGGEGRVYLSNSWLTAPTPNIVAYNDGAGVRVEGGATVGNTILLNSIHTNGGAGIENSTGGNHELPPPVDMSYGDGAIRGAVTDIGTVPAGSSVNVFSDMDDEGEAFIGRATVADDGTWMTIGLLPLPFENVTANVTHVHTGSTSALALADTLRSFNIGRSDGAIEPDQQPVTLGQGRMAVLDLTAIAEGDSVRVFNLVLKASGTLSDHTLVDEVSIYRDNDGDGAITEADSRIAGPASFDADDGSVSLAFEFTVVEPEEPQRWIVLYDTSQAPAAGTTFALAIENALAPTAMYLFPPGLASVPDGPFPVVSDTFTTGP